MTEKWDFQLYRLLTTPSMLWLFGGDALEIDFQSGQFLCSVGITERGELPPERAKRAVALFLVR